MHRDDQMTPKERAKALAKGERVDRMPISMFYFSPSHQLLGLTMREGDANARIRADIQKKVYETFGCDGVTAKYGLHSLGIAFGAKMTDPDYINPAILKHPVKDIRDLSILDLDIATVKKDPNAKKCYEMAQILLEEIGDEVGCVFGATGPFTSASALLGPERLMKALYQNPQQVHQLMEFTLAASLQIAKPFLELNMPISVSEPMASGVLLRKKHFDEFVLPYAKRFVEGCKEIRPFKITVHICGDTTKLLESMADCGYDTVSLDNMVDITEAKTRIGDKVHLIGNVEPVGILRYGNPDDVKKAVRECFQKGFGSPKGFTIGTGCDTPIGTPLENSFAYMQEARKCAQYPLDPAHFISSSL